MVPYLPFLLADAAQSTIATPAAPSSLIFFLMFVGLLAIALVLPVVLGYYIADALRMKDYAWKIAVVLGSLTCSAVILAPKPAYLGAGWPPKMGVDLNGGAILVYKVNLEGTNTADEEEGVKGKGSGQVKMSDVAAAIARRINPDGLKEIVVRPFGKDHLEIIIPEVDKIEVDRIKRTIEQQGELRFLIVANSNNHELEIAMATAQAESTDPKRRLSKNVTNEKGTVVATWVGVGRSENKGERNPYKVNFAKYLTRNPKTGEIIDKSRLEQYAFNNSGLEAYMQSIGVPDPEVLMIVGDKRHTVTGGDLGNNLARGHDPNNLSKPIVEFSLRIGDAANRMYMLTRDNLSDPGQNGFKRHLAIVMDGKVLSAPSIEGVISDRGQISGDFTEEEVDGLVSVLRSGKLPAALDKDPVSDNIIDPTLGLDTIIQGSWSIVVSLAAVIVFMLVYYRFSGVVACIALTINLILIVALMILLKAPFTLPGLAGMVLTIGMSVDANVLIYERMREELAKGAALRMTIRNGFDRAFTTIVDSNVTTIITALILYAIGTDQVKGFAVTLTIGILISMFTAIFCSRVIFDIAERQRWISTLHMMRFFTTTNFDFMGHWKQFATGSVVLITLGLVATFMRGKEIFDIDFLGGTSAEVVLREETSTEEVRKMLTNGLDKDDVQFSLAAVKMSGPQAAEMKNRVFKIDTSLTSVDKLQKTLGDVLKKDDKSILAMYSMTFTPPQVLEVPGSPPPAATSTTEKPASEKPATSPTDEEKAAAEKKAEEDKKAAEDKAAADKKAADEKKAAEDKAAADKKLADEKKAAEDKAAADKKAADDKKAAEEKKAADDKAAADKKAADEKKAAEDKKAADEKKAAADKKAAEDKAAADKKTADEKKAAEEKKAADDKKAAEAKAADEKKAAEDKAKTDGASRARKLTDYVLAFADDAADAKKKDLPGNTASDAAPDAPAAKKDEAKAEEPKKEEPKKEEAKKEEPKAEEPKKEEPKTEEPKKEESVPPKTETTTPAETTPPAAPAAAAAPAQLVETKMTFANAGKPVTISAETLRERLEHVASELNVHQITPQLRYEGAVAEVQGKSYSEWTVKMSVSPTDAKAILERLQADLETTPVFLSSSEIGGAVAENAKESALKAILASLVGIVLYIWVRFQRIVWGLAAVLALVHDVLMMLGAIAISRWLEPSLSFVMVEEFKISLVIIAAFLTLVGYSINDTIVVFDRIREVRGKSPNVTPEIINLSINQTLSRTVLTSLTTFLVVVVLYFMGGPSIHGFAFSLVVGVVVGTYSSIFIAAPMMLWMANEDKPTGPSSSAADKKVSVGDR